MSEGGASTIRRYQRNKRAWYKYPNRGERMGQKRKEERAKSKQKGQQAVFRDARATTQSHHTRRNDEQA